MYLLLSPNSIGVQVPIPLFHSAVQTDTLIKDEASVVGVIQRGSGQPAGVYTLIGEKVPFLAKECHRGHQVRPTWDSYPMSKHKHLVTTQSNCKIYSCFSWFVSENVNFTRSHLITKVARTPRGCLPALKGLGDV